METIFGYTDPAKSLSATIRQLEKNSEKYQRIKIWWKRFTPKKLERFCEALKNNTHITLLDISFFRGFTREHLTAILNAIHFERQISLRQLKLTDNGLFDSAANIIINWLPNMPKNLELINLDYNNFSPTKLTHLAEYFSKCPNLRGVSLQSTEIEPNYARKLYTISMKAPIPIQFNLKGLTKMQKRFLKKHRKNICEKKTPPAKIPKEEIHDDVTIY
jgi:hypothetical protein